MEEEEDEPVGPIPQLDVPPEVSTLRRVEVEIQERRDTKPGVPHVREWDRGKGKPCYSNVCKKTFTLLNHEYNKGIFTQDCPIM